MSLVQENCVLGQHSTVRTRPFRFRVYGVRLQGKGCMSSHSQQPWLRAQGLGFIGFIGFRGL